MQNICKYKCKFDGRKYNLNQNWNKELCRCECKNTAQVLIILACEINKNLSAVAKSYNDTSETAPISFNKKCSYKIGNFCILLAFL